MNGHSVSSGMMPVASWSLVMGASRVIRKVAVLGAGTMGSRIAAQIANAGVPVVLLDRVGGTGARSALAAGAVEALKKAKPAAFYEAGTAKLITAGNFEDDLGLVAECDWVIEVVAEDLEIKRALLARVAGVVRAGTVVTTNTSGLPVGQIVEGMPVGFRSHWFGTHFFNPPRYMRLVEVIATPETDAADVEAIARFCERRLGKTVVRSNDTPNFIANRIGTFTLANAMRLMVAQGLGVEEVDLLTGAAIGWPKTGTFRLGDMVGVDVLAHVATNFARESARIGDERGDVGLPDFVAAMQAKGWLGDKSGQGFYKSAGRDEQGREVRLALDWRTLEYGASVRPKFATLEMVKGGDAGARVRELLGGDAAKDKAVGFLWPLLTELLTYAANRLAPEANPVAESVVEIDRAMRAGFNWELGPFEMFDAAGVRGTTERMRARGEAVAGNVARLLEVGESWYRVGADGVKEFFDPAAGDYKPVPMAEGTATFAAAKAAKGVVRKNAGASVVDLGGGVAGIELHSKMNALGGDIVSLVTQVLRPGSAETAAFEAFVISGDGANFSVGANLMQLLLMIQDGEWDEVAGMITGFQGMTQAIKYCPRPVVVAPYGMCLGGGAEMALHGAARQAHAESYIGLVETGVGLIPGGGGCKEMLLRALDAATGIRPDGRGEGVEVFEAVKKAFEGIALAKVSGSAAEARAMGYLGAGDGVTMNRDRLLGDAVAKARALVEAGYSAPAMREDIAVPGESVLATLKLGVWTMREGGFISEHDVTVAGWAANILCGGEVAAGTRVSEAYLLELEREAFVSLCGEKKTQERIAFTLKTGKPLRN